MDQERLVKACDLVDKGKYSEAHTEFIQLAEDTPDPIEKAWSLGYAANALHALGQQEAAAIQLNKICLAPPACSPLAKRDSRLQNLENTLRWQTLLVLGGGRGAVLL
jgi:hypothetical protein